MEDTELKQRLKQLVVDRLFLNVAPEEIPEDRPLMEEFKVDSVAIFEIVVGLEEEFGITIEEEEFNLELFKTVDSMAELVRRKGAS